MSPTYHEAVRAQPANLVRSRAVVSAALDRLAPLEPPLIALGMGASAHAALGFAAALREAGFSAVALSAAEPPPPGAGTYLAISQSGRSRETADALASVAGGHRVALTNVPDSPVGRLASTVLPLGCGEDSRVSTLSYTATVQALGLLADRITGVANPDWAAVPDAVATALALDVDAAVSALAGVASVDVIGSGTRAASAGAAGLLLREAARLPAAAYPTREYLHGALEVAGPGRAALLFGAGREVRLAGDLADYGSAVVLVTDVDAPVHPRVCVLRLPALAGLAGRVAEIVPVQLVAAGLAALHDTEIALRYMPDDTKLPATGL
jgi:glutamine---fructose-6-phosphate transaminase (isomerizing)